MRVTADASKRRRIPPLCGYGRTSRCASQIIGVDVDVPGMKTFAGADCVFWLDRNIHTDSNCRGAVRPEVRVCDFAASLWVSRPWHGETSS